MNVIFLDVDGVLNYKNFEDEYFCEFLINQSNEHINVDPYKVKVLSNICKETNSKVVLSSSWKLLRDKEGKYKDNLKELLSLFDEYGIDFYGYTPNIPNTGVKRGKIMWKEYDIKAYLNEHKEVSNFCIFDDNIYDLESMKDYLIQTKWDADGFGNGGIFNSHLDDTKRILKLSSNFFNDIV